MLRVDQANTKTALVVDDDPWVRVILGAMLGEAGYVVSLASNGFSGLRLAKQIRPQLILLDLVLPEVSGVLVLRELRQQRATCQVPILLLLPALSADSLVDVLEADGFLRTPVVQAALIAEVRRATALREAALATLHLPARNPPVRPPQPPSREHAAGGDLLAPVLVAH